MTITVRFVPEGEPEVFVDPEIADWITVAALYRAAEGLDGYDPGDAVVEDEEA